MQKRRGKGQRPQIVFTSDFHELVRGDLIEGPCVLRYDPHRIVPEAELSSLPRTQRPVTAHVRFNPAGTLWTGDMRFAPASRLILDNDPTGQGTMLEIQFGLPPGCDELECWFSYSDDHGSVQWDSAQGANLWLRFPTHDLDIRKAAIKAQDKEPLDLFQIEVESVPVVDSIDVRWRYTNAINDKRLQCPLMPALFGARKRWTLPGDGAHVAWKTPLAFDLVYWVKGHKYADDNDGTWYIVNRMMTSSQVLI